ncbi:MAG: hypothetical protein ABIP03_12415 [Aquihabitans sp.]
MTNSGAAERFRIAAELADTGVALMRQNLRRRHPEATTLQIDALLREWLLDRPMDAPGSLRPLPA